MRFTVLVLFIILSLLLTPFAISQQRWQWLTTPTAEMQSVTSFQGKWYSVGGPGAVQVSTDGLSWTGVQAVTNAPLNSIRTLNNVMAAVGQAGTILTSADGENWIRRDSGTLVDLSSITYGQGRYVAVGCSNNANAVVYSQDLITWKRAEVGPSWDTPQFSAVIFGNGKFVLVALDSKWFISLDGVNWIEQPELFPVDGPDNATFANGTFVIVGDHEVAFSEDGLEWQVSDFSSHSFTEVAYFGGAWYATSADRIRKSTNLVTWEILPYFASRGIATNAGSMVALNTAGRSCITENGVAWLRSDIHPTTGVTHDGSRYVGANGPNFVESTDGVHWTQRIFGSNYQATTMAYLNGKYIAYSRDRNSVASSTDRVNWTIHANAGISNSYTVTNLVFGAGKYVAVRSNSSIFAEGRLAYSTDFSSWALGNPTLIYHDVAFGGGKFVAVGGLTTRAEYAVSTDGATWTTSFANGTPGGKKVVYGNGRFVMLTQLGASQARYSTDGVSWANSVISATGTYSEIAFANGVFLATGGSNLIARSWDGATWELISYPSAQAGGGTPVFNGSKWYLPGKVPLLSTSGLAGSPLPAPHWETLIPYSMSSCDRLLHLQNRWFALSGGVLYHSEDTMNWTRANFAAGDILCNINYINGQYIVTALRHIFRSADLVTWSTSYDPGFDDYSTFQDAADNGSIMVVVGKIFSSGSSAYILKSSTDGVTWTNRTVAASIFGLEDITYAHGRFVATGSGASHITSTDGINWEGGQSGSGLWGSVEAVNGGFLAVSGEYEEAAVSANGMNWTLVNGEKLSYVSSKTWSGSILAHAHGHQNHLRLTTDGFAWTEQYPGSGLETIAYGNGKFLATASTGGLLMSNEEPVPPAPTTFTLVRRGHTYIDLAWTPTLNAVGYVVETQSFYGDWVEARSDVDPSKFSVRITGLVPLSTNVYRLRSIHSTGSSFPIPLAGGPVTTVRPIEDWRWEHFGSFENAGSAANHASTDGDPLVNLVEYGFALDPKKNTTFPNFQHQYFMNEEKYQTDSTVSFSYNPEHTEVNLFIDFSPNLITWHPVLGSIAGSDIYSINYAPPTGSSFSPVSSSVGPDPEAPELQKVTITFRWLSSAWGGYYRLRAEPVP